MCPARLSILRATITFLELGFNSLLLSQVAQQIQRRLKVKIAFRQLLGDLSTIPALERFIRAEAPAEVKPPVVTAAPTAATAPIGAPGTAFVSPPPTRLDGTDAGIAAIMRAQVEAMSGLIQGQLDALTAAGGFRQRRRGRWAGRPRRLRPLLRRNTRQRPRPHPRRSGSLRDSRPIGPARAATTAGSPPRKGDTSTNSPRV